MWNCVYRLVKTEDLTYDQLSRTKGGVLGWWHPQKQLGSVGSYYSEHLHPLGPAIFAQSEHRGYSKVAYSYLVLDTTTLEDLWWCHLGSIRKSYWSKPFHIALPGNLQPDQKHPRLAKIGLTSQKAQNDFGQGPLWEGWIDLWGARMTCLPCHMCPASCVSVFACQSFCLLWRFWASLDSASSSFIFTESLPSAESSCRCAWSAKNTMCVTIGFWEEKCDLPVLSCVCTEQNFSGNTSSDKLLIIKVPCIL